jgi:hypothetical protein
MSEIISDAQSADNSLAEKALTVGAVAGSTVLISYEWGIGNEIITPVVVGRAAEIAEGIGGTALATAAGAGLVFAEQYASGALTAYATARAPRFTNWLSDKFANKNEDEDDQPAEKDSASWENLPLRDQFQYSMALGSSFAAIRERALVPNATTKEVIHQTTKSAKISAATVAILAFALDGSTRLAASTDEIHAGPVNIDSSSLAEAAETARDFIYDWRTWTLIFGARFAASGAKKLLNRFRSRTPEVTE